MQETEDTIKTKVRKRRHEKKNNMDGRNETKVGDKKGEEKRAAGRGIISSLATLLIPLRTAQA